MNRWILLPAAMLTAALVAPGCSGSGGSPVAPEGAAGNSTTSQGKQAQSHLWGYYDVYLDSLTETATVVCNRHGTFAANVVTFVNKPPTNLGFQVNGTLTGADYLDADIDVSITHPLAGMTRYNGYDVMGVLEFVPDIQWVNFGGTGFNAQIDHSMRDDPFNKDGGGPDGYTRWFNRVEFPTPGLFGYTTGVYATKGFDPSATLRPYRYFANGLGSHDDLWTFLNDNAADHGVFRSGSTNTRNYYIRFHTPAPGVKFGYTIVAHWEGESPQDHPANAVEAVAISVTVTDDIYYIDPTNNGGNLILDIGVFDWASEVAPGGVMEDYLIKIESTVLSSAFAFNTTDMTPVDGGEHFSTYHVEIPADDVDGTLDNEFWIIAEYADDSYGNGFGVPNSATGPLSAYFRHDLYVSGGPYNQAPVCDMVVVTPMPVGGWAPIEVEFNAEASYDPEGNPLTFEWDFDDDGTFGDPYESGTPGNPTKEYNAPYSGDVCVRVSDGEGGQSECCAPVSIGSYSSKNIPTRSGVDAYDIGVDPGDGDLLVLYSDGQVWRHRESNYYNTGSRLYTTLLGHNRIDISPGGCSITGGWVGGPTYARSYTDSGTLLSNHTGRYSPCGTFACVEVVGYNSPVYFNNHGAVMGYESSSICMNALITYLAPNYDLEWTFFTALPGYLTTRLIPSLIRGCERSDYDHTYMYYLEAAPQFTVERYTEINFVYTGVAWGGTQTDYMHGFNDPQDITRDNNNDYYILDWLSNERASVKKYTDIGGEIGQFGSSTAAISGDPLRIEGSDYNGNIFVLHTDGISIFFPAEMP